MTQNNVDLNRLRETLLNSQQGNPSSGSSDRVFVGPDGSLRLGGNAETSNRTLSEVPKGVFAGSSR